MISSCQSLRWRDALLGRPATTLFALLLLTVIGGCASVQGDRNAMDEDAIAEANDPLEGLNRQIFAVNLTIDTFLLRPAAVAYRELMPEPGKTMVRNFVDNLKLPFTALNDLAQGDFDRAHAAVGRFLVNTVLGIGGLFDPATELGLPYHKEDFGQTLAVWGMEDGPYLVLPLFGPSNFRDAIGTAVGWVADPVWIAANSADVEDVALGVFAADGVDARYRSLGTIDSLRERSLDFYATVRSLYGQRRQNEIRNGATDSVEGATILSEGASGGVPAGAVPQGPEASSFRSEPDAALLADSRNGEPMRLLPSTSALPAGAGWAWAAPAGLTPGAGDGTAAAPADPEAAGIRGGTADAGRGAVPPAEADSLR